MICSYCGKEFKTGQVYCPHCGKMQQLVPDYFEAEEEILSDGHAEEIYASSSVSGTPDTEKNMSGQRAGSAGGRKRSSKNTKAAERKRKKRRNTLIVMLIVLAAAVLIIGGLVLNSMNNDYDLQMKKAQTAYENGNYDKAQKHATRALTLDGGSVKARILLYRIYDETGVTDLTLLTEVLALDSDNKDAYRLLIAYYDAQDDYDSLLELAENVPYEDLLELFEGYLTQSPVLTPEAGTYEHITEVTIESEYTVYYTTDGSTPTTDSDIYEEAIVLESGTWTVMAAASDEEGNLSLVTSAVYVIDPEQPSMVKFSPSGGSYTQQISITLSADDGCTIYYGWDTTDPDELTTEYTGSVKVIEGNHILSAIAVSEDGLISDVSSKSFIYLPEENGSAEE